MKPSPANSPDATRTFEARLRTLRTEQRNSALPGLVLTYAALVGLLALPLWLSPWHLLWWVPVVGVLQYRVVISGHEAVHYTLCFPRGLNEVLGVVGQALIGVNFSAYRIQHLDHHRVRKRKDDPDGYIYGAVVDARPGLWRFLVLTLGTPIELVVKIRQKGTGGIGNFKQQSMKERRGRMRDTGAVVLAQLALIGVTWAVTGWPVVSYLLLWVLPLFAVAVTLNRCRIVIEHGLAHLIARKLPGGLKEFGGPRIPTVDIVPNALERLVFAPFLFNYHCCHHLFMTVPHYNLPQLRGLLREHEHAGYHEVRGSYISALVRTLSE
jgi:fatty acid desaturase